MDGGSPDPLRIALSRCAGRSGEAPHAPGESGRGTLLPEETVRGGSSKRRGLFGLDAGVGDHGRPGGGREGIRAAGPDPLRGARERADARDPPGVRKGAGLEGPLSHGATPKGRPAQKDRQALITPIGTATKKSARKLISNCG